MSLPSRERGLKFREGLQVFAGCPVAPLAGAWIEISTPTMRRTPAPVAPLAGAWIEILAARSLAGCPSVAPLAGAWIEIEDGGRTQGTVSGRSPRGSVD